MVMKVTFDCMLRMIDEDAFNKLMFDQILNIMENGALVFFLTATNLVHVDTGMAIGSYLGLAAYLGETIDQLDTRNVYDPTKIYDPPGGPKMKKLPQSGAKLSAKRKELFEIDRVARKVRFNFYTGVWHYQLLDPQWGSMDAGNEAMLAYIAAQKLRVPDVDAYTTKYTWRTTAQGGLSRTVTPVRRQKTSRNRRKKP